MTIKKREARVRNDLSCVLCVSVFNGGNGPPETLGRSLPNIIHIQTVLRIYTTMCVCRINHV